MMCHWTHGLVYPVLAALLMVISAAEWAGAQPATGSFAPASNGIFLFDTGELRGQLRTDQLAFGLHNVENAATGKKLSGSYGLMNVYRVFSDGRRYGSGGWEWSSRAIRREDGTVLIECAAEDTRPFQLSGVYRWSGPATLDLEIQVTPREPLRAFEVLLASYCDPVFARAQVNVQQDSGHSSAFLSAEKSGGDWQMFPRDDEAVKLIQDGRWQLPPHPVQWRILPRLERPLAVRRAADDGTTLLFMTRPEDCFAIAMPYETEVHFSVYLSLFGRDLPAGESATAKARLQVLHDPSDEQIIDCFERFVEQK